ncbi:MAG: ABC transporter permease [Alphaproteobacteria bacterium]|nr:ABC transporter permease [Alphaproteobacteria bacterium]
MTRLGHGLPLMAASMVGGMILWEMAASGVSGVIFAPPSVVLARLAQDTLSGVLPMALLGSLAHLAVGFLLAVAVALPLGFAIGRSPPVAAMVEPVMNAIYAVPPVAMVPFLIIWFGLFYEARVALVFLMSVFEILVTVTVGARNVDPMLLQVGRSFGANRFRLVTVVMLPASLPFVFTALRVGLVRAINAMITAELFLAAVNLGALMKQSAQRFDMAGLLSLVVLLCLLGLAAQEGLKALESRLLPWHVRPSS